VRWDVVVVGLGSMGAAAAYRLAASGVRVLGLDRFEPPHERGAHAGGSRIIRMAYMEGADYVPLLRRSYELWRELEAASGERLVTMTGGLMLGRADSMPVGGALAAARAHGLAHELLDAAEVHRRYPAFTPADDEVAVAEEVAGLVRPERTIATNLRLARAAGADLRTGVAVQTWRGTAGGVTVVTGDGEIEADRLVLAPGAWSPELTRLAVPMRIERRVQHYWEAEDPASHAIGAFPAWIWESGGTIAYGLPTVDVGAKAAFHAPWPGQDTPSLPGSKTWHGGAEVDPDTAGAPVTEAEVRGLRDWLSPRLPGLGHGRWLDAKPCLYTLTPDGHFVLGRHPGDERVVVACGFSGHGFKFVPVIAEVVADLVVDGATRHPIGLFDPARFGAPR